jgi:hypothetical protein
MRRKSLRLGSTFLSDFAPIAQNPVDFYTCMIQMNFQGAENETQEVFNTMLLDLIAFRDLDERIPPQMLLKKLKKTKFNKLVKWYIATIGNNPERLGEYHHATS